MKIGIFGGSFNPVHSAHIELAKFFRNELFLDKVLLIPAYCSPFKNRSEYLVDDLHRLNMVNLAIEDISGFEIEDFELKKSVSSFTIDTIDYLVSKEPESEFYMLIGYDQWQSFHLWKEWQSILQKVKICIAGRIIENHSENSIAEKFSNENKNIEIIYLNSPLIDISSKDIRKRISSGKDLSDLLPEKVMKYIIENNLYL